MVCYTAAGERLVLSAKALGDGGEGSVHEVVGKADLLAKIYKETDVAEAHRLKVEEMAHTKLPRSVDRRVAWPVATLYKDPGCSSFAGFIMPRLDERISLEELYEYPAPPEHNFPVSDRLRVMESLARTVAELHAQGHVIGDFNDGNVGVISGHGCEVGIHDADSFHIKGADGTLYRCSVCFPGWAAPEVLRSVRGYTYATTPNETFTQQSDDWALAVHVFKAIFGVHPYHCAAAPVPAGGSAPAASGIDKRVERGETPYFRQVIGYRTAPYAPPITSLPPYLKEAFHRAFVDGHSDPLARPSASEWEAMVHRYLGDLETCAASPAHQYWRGLPGCPYCKASVGFSKALVAYAPRTSSQGCAPKHLSHASAQPVTNKATTRAASPGKVVAHPAFGKVLRAVLYVAAGGAAAALAVVVLIALVQALLPGAICAAIFVAFIAGLDS